MTANNTPITYAEMDEIIAKFQLDLCNTSTDNLMELARRIVALNRGLTEELRKVSGELTERQRYLTGCLMQIETHNTQTQEA